ncbi:toxin-antitoxin system, toxin component, RelE domain protein [Cedecea davisae DSM 4568]|uniref:Toxin-antitoxin system, toxin component, RelE domain protein n=1 Tax=Cedecea davisae DSM 4568 TaxID=566551 RepID=S3J658_9ENTR|nr:toxin-antitoxin system, toxin component, RelE domain protein [Cedecea davisae DSM 4568]
MPILRHYLTQDGRDPFNAFLMDVKDPIAKAMIAVRVARMGEGTMETASHAGKAYRN